MDVWVGDKSRKGKLGMHGNRSAVVVSYKDGKEPAEQVIQLDSVKKVVLGNPIGMKKKFFGKSAKADRSLVLETGDGALLLHAEFEEKAGADERVTVAKATAAVVGVNIDTRQ